MERITAKDKILSSALDLIMTRGYQVTTVDEIVEHAGVSKGSFYYFYKSKEELGMAALMAFYQHDMNLVGDGDYVEIENPVERALAFLEFIEENAENFWQKGCLMGRYAMEISKISPEIFKQNQKLFRNVEKSYAEIMGPLCKHFKGKDAPTADDLAKHMMVVIEGGILMAKAHGKPARLSDAVREFRRYINCLLGR